jgi:invasion protein IalB
MAQQQQQQQQEPVLGGATDNTAAPPASWASRCVAQGRTATLDCSVMQRAVTQQGEVVGSVTIRVPPDTGKPVLIVSTPLGLYLPAGVTYSIDTGTPQQLQLETCDRNGCYASTPLSDDMVNAMLKGQKLNVAFQSLNKQTITLPMSLVGFTAAYQRIK